jgi:TetR/AcrR family transcriptional repressor of nem operon
MPRPDKGTRQKLIDTATDLIWMSSYGSVSVDDICKKADVKKGSFYHYFPSKQDLAIAAMEEHFQHEVEPDMIRVFAANTPFAEQIDSFVDAILTNKKKSLEKYGRVCGCPLAALGSEMIGQDEQVILEKVEEMFGRIRNLMLGSIKSAIDAKIIPAADPASKTLEIHDFITGLMIMARIHNTLDGMERDLRPGMIRILGLDTQQRFAQNRI